MTIESERKYLNVDIKNLLSNLKDLGKIITKKHFETNIVFDTQNHAFYSADKLLRLRLREWPDKNDCMLTLKLPVSNNTDNVKIKEELEIKISDWEIGQAILTELGFMEFARYEKIRESWQVFLQNGAHVHLDLDILPFITAVEIEGSESDINDTEKMLGLDKFKKSIKSYHELHQKWLISSGLQNTASFVFPDEKRKALRMKMGL